MIYTRRAYDIESDVRGERFLVDRVWPRGLKKEEIKADWLRDAAPSDEIRQRFHADGKWETFRESYFRELDANPPAWTSLMKAARQGDVVLLYGSRDTEHNNAMALKEYLEEKLNISNLRQ